VSNETIAHRYPLDCQYCVDRKAEIEKLTAALTAAESRAVAAEQARDQYKELTNRALKAVDRVFQVGGQAEPPILPDFLLVGSCKFEGVVKLAEEYRKVCQERDEARKLYSDHLAKWGDKSCRDALADAELAIRERDAEIAEARKMVAGAKAIIERRVGYEYTTDMGALPSSKPRSPDCGGRRRGAMTAKNREWSRLDAEALECICQTCECGIADEEPRTYQSMSGSSKTGATKLIALMYWHDHKDHCIRALKERVRELERIVSSTAIRKSQEPTP
jgi:hypothetical protein